jgi:ABC-type polysaccharide/polyol phosphate export permease
MEHIMKRILSDNARIFCALIQRDMKVFGSKFKDAFIDGMCVVMLQVIMCGYLLPQMGMKPSLIAPLYISTFVLMLFTIGFSQSLRMVFDIKFNRYVDYLITLPLPKTWLFSTYIFSFMLETFLTTLPLITIGIFTLRQHFPLDQIQWLAFLAFYLLSLLFMSVFILALALSFSYQWYMDNIWPRILSPLLCIGAIFFTWHGINQFSPRMAQLTLFNPFTYIAEGIRTGLLGGSEYLPFTYCVPAVGLALVGAVLLLARGIKHRLDPV